MTHESLYKHTVAPLQQYLQDSFAHTPIASADTWLRCLARGIQAQITDYGRFCLPYMGMAQLVEWPACNIRLHNTQYRQRDNSLWIFDMTPVQSWLDLPLYVDFESVDGHLILIPQTSLDQKTIKSISPPVPARLKNSLYSLPFVVADCDDQGDDRISHEAILSQVGNNPWYIIDHQAKNDQVRIEQWQGATKVADWKVDIIAEYGQQAQQWLAHQDTSLSSSTDTENLFRVLIVFRHLLSPYNLCNQTIKQLFGLNMSRLGPYLLWRDEPDVLFEYDEREDRTYSDLSLSMAEELSLPPEIVAQVLEFWCRSITSLDAFLIPTVGIFYAVPQTPFSPRCFVSSNRPLDTVLIEQAI